MEEPSADWEIQEYLTESNSSKASWLWSKGLVLGKKVLVTGILISSAPFVLPPLAVVSALGAAVSIPYGLFFASYTCSEKLLSKLLPGTSPPLFLDFESALSAQVEEEDLGNRGDIDMDREKSEEAESIKEELEMRTEIVRGNEGEKAMESCNYDKRGEEDSKDLGSEICKIVGENVNKPTTQESVHKPRGEEMQGVLLNVEVDENEGNKCREIGVPLEVANVIVLESGKQQKMTDGELVRETRGLTKKFADEGRAPNAVKEDKMHSEDICQRDYDMDLPIEAKNFWGKGKKKRKSKKDKAEGKRIENEEKKATQKEIEKSANDEKQKTVPKSKAERLTEGTSEGTLPSKVIDNGDTKSTKFLAPVGLNQERCDRNLAEKGIAPTFHEEIYREERIWQQIEAMRKIVGYKATRQASCIEELKALYVFTGVEPPTLFKDASGLEEVNDKLRFLMSVVGVM